jgi:peptidoglycan-associated lipoprotein
MTEQSTLSFYRHFSLILICTLLGACATTQRSSSGAGEQAAEPATQTATAPQTAAKSDSSAPDSSSAGTSSNSAPTAVTSASTDTNADQGMPRSSSSDEAAQLKNQLAEQAAQISTLREEQKAEAERIEMAEQQKTAQQEAQQQAAAASAAASPVVATRPDDKAAEFPQDANAGARASQARQQSPAANSSVANSIERSVYFAFDQAKVDEKYDDMVMANAAYLKSHSEVKAEVQGNCDERGSREYNLALGSRRAHAVKRALEVAGADSSRIVATSFGAEKPVAPGKDEASYSRNRRADIVY